VLFKTKDTAPGEIAATFAMSFKVTVFFLPVMPIIEKGIHS
jgi:hypothetical protein